MSFLGYNDVQHTRRASWGFQGTVTQENKGCGGTLDVMVLYSSKESRGARVQRIGTGIGVVGGALAYHSAGPQFQFDVATAGTALLKLADAETAHRIGMWAASKGLVPRETRLDPPSLHTRVWGRDFANPLGRRTYLLLQFGEACASLVHVLWPNASKEMND